MAASAIDGGEVALAEHSFHVIDVLLDLFVAVGPFFVSCVLSFDFGVLHEPIVFSDIMLPSSASRNNTWDVVFISSKKLKESGFRV